MGGPGSGRRKVLAAAEKPPATKVQTSKPRTTKRGGNFYVNSLVGGRVDVLTQQEKRHYESTRDRYKAEVELTTASDLADMDRLLFQELLVYRWQKQLSQNKDYAGDTLQPVLADQYRRNLAEASRAITTIKTDLGMTRDSRSKDEGSVGGYLTQLLKRANHFGVTRNLQVNEALVLFNEMASHIGAFDRANEKEREKLGFETEEDLVEWFRTIAIPRFRAIDEKFVLTEQQYWTAM